MFRIKKGLNVPISGAPEQTLKRELMPYKVAVLGADYLGLKPSMKVAEGDVVSKGQVIFVDKKNPSVNVTAPVAGTITAIHRGERRKLLSVEIAVNLLGEEKTYTAYSDEQVAELSVDDVKAQMTDSGMWAAFRTRPFSKVPSPDSTAAAIFVTATDSNPLTVDPHWVIAADSAAFQTGLALLSKLTEGNIYVCIGKDDIGVVEQGNIAVRQFVGVHPAGNVGTHIHKLRPASLKNVIWHMGYQDVIALGKLFATGKIDSSRVISIAGPQVKDPEIVTTLSGAALSDLTFNNLKDGTNRVISGSILSGRNGSKAESFLGRYHNQVSVIEESEERPMLHYVVAGRKRFSAMPIYLSKLFPKKVFDFTATTNGSERAMVPVGAYEKIMPLDILPTQLLRDIIVGDTQGAQQLGVLELDEEDLALCTFVCPGKYEYGPILRDNLDRIEREG